MNPIQALLEPIVDDEEKGAVVNQLRFDDGLGVYSVSAAPDSVMIAKHSTALGTSRCQETGPHATALQPCTRLQQGITSVSYSPYMITQLTRLRQTCHNADRPGFRKLLNHD